MKRFRFALEKVLGYRRQVEFDRRRTLALAIRVFRSREEDLNAVAAQVDAYRNRLAEMSTGKVSARELALYRSYLTHLEAQMSRCAQWVRDARSTVDQRRAELVAAAKEAKILEKLKSRDRVRYDYAARREEGTDLDEIGMTGYIAGQAAEETA